MKLGPHLHLWNSAPVGVIAHGFQKLLAPVAVCSIIRGGLFPLIILTKKKNRNVAHAMSPVCSGVWAMTVKDLPNPLTLRNIPGPY